MFDNLSEKLQRVFKNLRGEGKLTAANMATALSPSQQVVKIVRRWALPGSRAGACRDYDETSNLQRQWLFEESHATEALPKTVAAERAVRRTNA